jgi:ferredoxin-NADP reductase
VTIAPGRSAPLRWQKATIQSIAHQSPRAVSVFLDAPIARHMAGQHINVRLTAPDGYAAQRSYSISSAPGSSHIELLIERLDEGEVSPYFHEVAQAGDVIEVRGPIGGHFVWRPDDGGPLLLVAGGSGIAPLMAMTREWTASGAETPLKLVYSARTWEELAFRDELLALEAAKPHFALTFSTTRGESRRATDFGRRLGRDLWMDILARWGKAPRHVFICGSNAFVDAMAASLIEAGIKREAIRTERYGGNAA